ncbi:F-box/LRR-repeat protein 13-like [Papaver somniferum]|uniref:F-box/LRR-repeat protein 13-like n=1 Tax=Papaver somniferum TaxID=3469 RepID=UPI000E6FD3D5|nr:F-box/LRR-repeat protein 13-like [Papaver somniferum]XP_026431009.1 F-box/LRR-repeat protein 13-like [Papaver somniferum]
MSFVDTKNAVQTCVLSKRWIDTWKSLPFLKFDRDSFSEDRTDSFIMFADMVLLSLREDFDIQKFTVHWKNSAYDDSVMMNVIRWSLTAVEYNVVDLSKQIDQLHITAYEIPHRLLNCRSLKKLIISAHGNARYVDIVLPGSMSLPQLKLLFLIGLAISDVESSKRLFSSCPVLETLFISNFDIQTDNARKLIVDSLSLKKFEFYDHRRGRLPQYDTTAIIIKLCAPNLEEFNFRSLFTINYCLENCSPLSRAYFDMTLRKQKRNENTETYESLHRRKFYMLNVLAQTPDLVDCRQPPRLNNLQCLILEMWSTGGCLRAVAYLLKISPSITHLVLESMESNLGNIEDDWEAGLILPGKLSHLKLIRINDAEECDAELELLSFLFKNAKVLEKVVVCFGSSVGSPDRVTQVKQFQDKLRALPRSSSVRLLPFVFLLSAGNVFICEKE